MDVLGEDLEAFDFVVKTSAKTYLIEGQFLQRRRVQVERSSLPYSDLALKINQNPGL